MLTGFDGWRIFLGPNGGSSKIIDRCLHSTYVLVVNNILIGSLFPICESEGHLFFVFFFPYHFLDIITIIDLY
jgi:hypothetical protein